MAGAILRTVSARASLMMLSMLMVAGAIESLSGAISWGRRVQCSSIGLPHFAADSKTTAGVFADVRSALSRSPSYVGADDEVERRRAHEVRRPMSLREPWRDV